MTTQTPKTPHQLWVDLLYGDDKYLGQLWSAFATEKKALVEHLDKCKTCRAKVNSFYPNGPAPNFKKMSDPDFVQAARSLRRLSTSTP